MADALSLLPPGYRPISPEALTDEGDARSATLDAPAEPFAMSMLPQGYVPIGQGAKAQSDQPSGDPIAAQMDARVAQEREANRGPMQTADDFIRNLTTGTVVGS